MVFRKKIIRFLIVYFSIFIILFLIFNGRAIFAQFKYALGLNKVSKNNELRLPLSENIEKSSIFIYIPKINVLAPIILTNSFNEKDIQKDLEKGVVLYKNTGYFEKEGKPTIIGHSSAFPWYRGKYGSVFALLNKLEKNDEVVILENAKSENTKIHRYKVKNKVTASVRDVNNLIKNEKNDGTILILISCWPIGTDWKRIVVIAEISK